MNTSQLITTSNQDIFSSDRSKVSVNFFLVALLFFIGALLHIIAYQTLFSLLPALLFYSLGEIVLLPSMIGGYFEQKIFQRVFLINWCAAGIAACYANFLNDPNQNYLDAAFFFSRSVSTSGLSLEELSRISEGSGAIFIWRAVYDIFAQFGFDIDRYIGIDVNILSVAFTGVLGVKMVRHVYGDDVSRMNRFILLFSSCGLFWLFSSIHLRDAFVLFLVTLNAYSWTRYLKKLDSKSLFFLIVAHLFLFFFMRYFRGEFKVAPFAFIATGVFVVLNFSKIYGKGKVLFNFFLISCILVILFWFYQSNYDQQYTSILTRGYTGYLDHAILNSSTDSLGMRLIVNQPLFFRLPLGTVYLFIFPLPFWSGFQMESVYDLYKSFNVIFFYAVIPLFIMSMHRIIKSPSAYPTGILFNSIVFLGFTIAIAGTSLETRHFGSFLVPYLIVLLLPDLTLQAERRKYKQLLLYLLSIVTVVHFVWVYLKVF